MIRALLIFGAVAAAVATVILSTPPARAFSGGVSLLSGNPAINFGDTCDSCHGGGSTPAVTLSGPTVVAPSTANTYVLTVQSTNVVSQTAAGLDVSATAGLLASLGPDTQILDGEVTHTAAKFNDVSGLASFTFQWTAPNAGPQIVTLYAAGNSVDMDGRPFGDAHANTTLVIEVAEPTAVGLAGLAAGTERPVGPGLAVLSGAALLLAAGLAGWRRLAHP
jgi:hypothetical protein